jgi:hypothetical protein
MSNFRIWTSFIVLIILLAALITTLLLAISFALKLMYINLAIMSFFVVVIYLLSYKIFNDIKFFV